MLDLSDPFTTTVISQIACIRGWEQIGGRGGWVGSQRLVIPSNMTV